MKIVEIAEEYTIDKLRDVIIKELLLSLPVGLSPFFSGLIVRFGTWAFNKYVEPQIRNLIEYINDMREIEAERDKLKAQVQRIKDARTRQEWDASVDALG